MQKINPHSSPELIEEAWTYFNEEQTADAEYTPFIAPDDHPAIRLNEDIMQEWRPQLEEYYYDPDRFDTYLEQLGIEYPTVRTPAV